MEMDESKIWTKFYGKEICKEDLKIEGFDEPIPFTIYDGHAVCDDFNGHRYDMIYPQMKAIKGSKELQEVILEYCDDIEDVQEISPIHSLITFNTLYEDGVEVLAEEEAEALVNA